MTDPNFDKTHSPAFSNPLSDSPGHSRRSSWTHPIRGIAFDMDGLMVNTEELYTLVGDTILRRRGRRFTLELKRAIMGLPGPRAYAVMIEQESLTDSPAELSREADELFLELLPRRVQPLPGLLGLLDQLDQLRLPRCVATSSSRHFAEQVLQLVLVFERVDFIVTAEDVAAGKPAPDIYQAAALKMGIEAPEMLVLEDSQNGTRAGVAAGACTIAVPSEHSYEHDFSGAFRIADSLADPAILRLISSGSR